MIRALSPYYITVPLQYTTSSTVTCEYFKLYITVWSGAEGSVPTTPSYVIDYDNPTLQTNDHVINIAPLLRDFIEFTPSAVGNTFSIVNAFGNQQWVNTYVKYDEVAFSYQEDTSIFTSGYSYGNDGANSENRTDTTGKPQILLENTDYSAHRGGVFNVPITLDDLTTTTNVSVKSFPSLQINEPTNIVAQTTQSDNKIKNIWIPTAAATTDEYIRVTFNGDTIDLVLKDEFRYDPMTVFFVNKYGAQQTFIFFKEQSTSLSVTDNTFESNIGQPSTGTHQFLRYNVQARTTLKASSGFIDEGENEAVKQLMLSERVWMYDIVDGFTPLNIKTTSTTFKTRQKQRLINYDVEFLMGYNEINNI